VSPRVTAAELRAAHLANGCPPDLLGPAPTPRRKRGPTPESLVLRECLAYLKQRFGHGRVHRMNSGVAMIGDRRVQFGFIGCPDIYVNLPDGRALWVEVKSATGTVSPNQREFLNSLDGVHQMGIVARSVADVKGVIG
jgi:hypothetical protein